MTPDARPARPLSTRRRPTARWGLLLLSLVLAGGLVSIVTPSATAAAPTLRTGAVSVVARSADDGLPPKKGDDFARPPERCVKNPYAVVSPCRVTKFRGRPFMVLWGDSHALMYLTPVRALAQRQRVNLVLMSSGSCPVALPTSRTRPGGGCQQHNWTALDYVRDLTERVGVSRVKVIIGDFYSNYRRNWSLVQREQRTGEPSGVSPYHAGLAEFAVKRSYPMFERLRRIGVSTDVMDQPGTPPSDPPPCLAGTRPYACDLARSAAMPDEAGNTRWLRARADRVRGGRLIDPSPTYCDSRVCHARVGSAATWYDYLHLGEHLTRSMQRYFRPSFADLRR